MYDNCVVLLNDNSYSLENIKKKILIYNRKKRVHTSHFQKGHY